MRRMYGWSASWSGVPSAMMRPASRMAIWSTPAMDAARCAMTRTVFPWTRRLDIGCGLRIGEGSGLVENEDGGIDEESTRNRDSLSLATRGMRVLPNDGVEASGQGTQVVVDARGPGGRPHRFVAGVRDSQRDVVAHGDVEELRILEDEGDVPVENIGGDVASINPTDAYVPLVRVSEARNQRRERRFSRSGGPNEGDHRALGDGQTDVVQREGRPVGEGHAINLDIGSLRR